MHYCKKEGCAEVIDTLLDSFGAKGVEVLLEVNAAQLVDRMDLARPFEEIKAEAEVLLVLGGDGAFLHAAHLVCDSPLPIMGINLGHLGFLTEAEVNDLPEAVEQLAKDDYVVEERMMLEAQVLRAGQETGTFVAFNDVVVTRSTFARVIQVEVKVDGQVTGRFSCDGMIVASPTGSTAYSLSAGGPVVSPRVEALVITPICPHTIASRSVVVHPQETIELRVHSLHDQVRLSVDGQPATKIQAEDRILVGKSERVARLVRLGKRGFYELLRNRLSHPDV